MKTVNSIKFKIKGIKTEQFALVKTNYAEDKKVSLKTRVNFKLNREKSKVGVFVDFMFEQKPVTFLVIEVSCHFEIEKETFRNMLNQKTNVFTIPKNFASHLAMITIGTARGVLFAKLEGTDFSKFIVPTVNASKLIIADIKFTPKNPLIKK